VLRAITAIFLVAVALGDLAIDADCDPLSFTSGASAITMATDDNTDACAAGCIPDCFCCSRSLAAAPRVSPPAPDGVAAALAVAAPGLPPGFSVLDDRPPRARV
jgi:hypothetical protein